MTDEERDRLEAIVGVRYDDAETVRPTGDDTHPAPRPSQKSFADLVEQVVERKVAAKFDSLFPTVNTLAAESCEQLALMRKSDAERERRAHLDAVLTNWKKGAIGLTALITVILQIVLWLLQHH